MLIVITVLFLASIGAIVLGALRNSAGSSPSGTILLIAGILGCCVFPILYGGLKTVGPNEALVLTLFGKYYRHDTPSGLSLRRSIRYI